MPYQRALEFTVAIAVFFAVSMAGIRPASAQFFAGDDGDDGLLVTSTTTTTTALVVGGIMLTVVNLIPQDEATAMATYLRQNAVAVRHDMTLGGGDAIEDLAEAFGVPGAHTAHFGRVLRENRAYLLSLAAPESMSVERAARFIATVRHAMGEDPSLLPYVTSGEAG